MKKFCFIGLLLLLVTHTSFSMQKLPVHTDVQLAKFLACSLGGVGCAYGSYKCFSWARWCLSGIETSLKVGEGATHAGKNIIQAGEEFAKQPDHCNVNTSVFNPGGGLLITVLGGLSAYLACCLSVVGIGFCAMGTCASGLAGLGFGVGSFKCFRAALRVRNALLG